MPVAFSLIVSLFILTILQQLSDIIKAVIHHGRRKDISLNKPAKKLCSFLLLGYHHFCLQVSFLENPPGDAGGLDSLRKTKHVSAKAPRWYLDVLRDRQPAVLAAPDLSPPLLFHLPASLKKRIKTSGTCRSIIINKPLSSDCFADDFQEW